MIVWMRLLLLCCLLFRGFSVVAAEPDLSPVAMASALAAFQLGQNMGHPRLFKGQADFSSIVAAASSERIVGVKALEDYLRRVSVRSTDTAYLTISTGSNNVSSLNNWFRQERALEGMAESAFVWYLKHDAWYLAELKARADIFAPQILDQQCKGEPMQTRAYAWYFALAYDFAFSALSSQEKARFQDVIKACTKAALDPILASVVANPKNGVAFHALGKFVGALLIVLRDVPEAGVWLKPALQTYVSNLSPWGGNDGGYSNGTSYAHWDTGESLFVWDLLDRVLDVPIYQKPWVAELPRFIAYTLPPGTPAGIFGDGAELNRKEEWARFGKALMSRFDSPLARWYEKQLFGEDSSRLHILLSPRVSEAAAAWPAWEPSSKLFASVGWAAMHSSMAARERVSVYFKSSPYGSLNHSHADQNSFLVYAHGQILAMDSGYYDYYNSPHWRDWYKQTRAHNAITFDGGLGQKLGTSGLGAEAFSGKVAQFSSSDEYDITTGDATSAFGGELASAKRTLVFFKPATLVVIDQVVGYQARQWEWNLHTTAPLIASGEGYRQSLEGAEMCVRVTSPDLLSLHSKAGYLPAPKLATPIAPHFWSRFSYAAPKVSGLFVSVLRMDCAIAEPKIIFGTGGGTVRFGARTISITTGGVSVQ